MARVGITKEQVFAAANQLVAQGTHPSINAVRDVLGTGSNGTIHKHLKEWTDARPTQKAPEFVLPVELTNSLGKVIEQEKAKAAKEVEDKLAQVQAQADTLADDVERLEAQLDAEQEAAAALTAERDEQAATIGALRLELRQLELHLQGEQQAKNAAHLEVAGARLKLEAQGKEITELTTALTEARKTAETAESAKRDAEAQRAALQVKADAEHGRAEELARRLHLVEQQAADATADARRATEEAKASAAAAAEAKLATKDAEARADKAERELAAAGKTLDAVQAEAKKALDAAKAEAAELRAQLAAATAADTELKQLAIGLEKPKK